MELASLKSSIPPRSCRATGCADLGLEKDEGQRVEQAEEASRDELSVFMAYRRHYRLTESCEEQRSNKCPGNGSWKGEVVVA